MTEWPFADSKKDREQIEKKLKLSAGYFDALLLEGSDWEFAIKLVVLLEAALGHVLATRLQNEAVRRHCGLLPISLTPT